MIRASVLAALVVFFACLNTAAGAGSVGEFTGKDAPEDAVWLDTLDISKMLQDWSTPKAAKSVDGNPILIGGVSFAHGVGTHANSVMMIDLKGSATKFLSIVGIDDETAGNGTVSFQIWVDGAKAADSGDVRPGENPRMLIADLQDAEEMVLIVTDSGDGIANDHADWAGAMILLKPEATEKPEAVLVESPTLPISSYESPKPEIHGPRIVGTTPGKPFLFLVPATGHGDIQFSADKLPDGLKLDSKTGIITGSAKAAGETVVTLTAKSAFGECERTLKIVAGQHKLALTPPMGWNSWNAWGCAVDAEKVRSAAESMIKTGLAAHGYQHVNIDDCWEAERDENGEIQTNEKFPDMKGLADYVHSLGLKLGIYSSPGPKTCAGFEGSYQHEQQDADTWAKWGIDYLKHDWCSYGNVADGEGLEKFQKPYKVMRKALDNCSRDIVFSLCQYGMENVSQWGADVGGNLWRTTGDITDTWSSMSGIGFNQAGLEDYAGPGHWNDPDMLVVGKVGWGPNLRLTRLTQNEQITHITLWTLLASPMLLGCDLAQLDQWTIDLLTNDEVIDVHQDPLGKQAGRRSQKEFAEVWSRPLWDGTTAVGLFNRGPWTTKVTAAWKDLGIQGKQPVRDLWQRKDLEDYEGSFTIDVPAHGAVLVKIGQPGPTEW